MPLYEYECDCGKRSEQVRSIAERFDATCGCGETPRLLISRQGKPLIAHTFTTYGHDGRIIGQRQTTEITPVSGTTPSGKQINVKV